VNWLSRLKTSVLTVALLAAFIAWPARASAGEHQVWDEAHLFKLDTLDQVNATLQQINERFDKDLMVETFASIPDDFKQRYTDQDREKFYDGWAIAEARQLGINGILILITGEPRHLHVVVGYDTRKVAFTLADRDELVSQLTAAFRTKQYDAGIVAGAKFVHDRMTKNMAAAASSRPGPSTRPGATTGPSTQPAKKDDGPGSF
jgi:uncharacterized membrane protein YgcG